MPAHSAAFTDTADAAGTGVIVLEGALDDFEQPPVRIDGPAAAAFTGHTNRAGRTIGAISGRSAVAAVVLSHGGLLEPDGGAGSGAVDGTAVTALTSGAARPGITTGFAAAIPAATGLIVIEQTTNEDDAALVVDRPATGPVSPGGGRFAIDPVCSVRGGTIREGQSHQLEISLGGDFKNAARRVCRERHGRGERLAVDANARETGDDKGPRDQLDFRPAESGTKSDRIGLGRRDRIDDGLPQGTGTGVVGVGDEELPRPQ